jgi:hypothetical protein
MPSCTYCAHAASCCAVPCDTLLTGSDEHGHGVGVEPAGDLRDQGQAAGLLFQIPQLLLSATSSTTLTAEGGPIASGETAIDPIQLRLAVLCAGSQNGTSSLLGAAAG